MISGHNPSGTSVRTVFQFARSYNLGSAPLFSAGAFYSTCLLFPTGQKFTKYDYGPQGNLEHYGMKSKVKTTTYIPLRMLLN